MNRKGFSLILILLIAAFVLAIGGAWWYANKTGSPSQPQRQARQVPISTTTSQNSPAPSQSQTATNQYSNIGAAGSSAVSSSPHPLSARSSATLPAPSTPDISCASQYTDTSHMDIFDAHTHIISDMSASRIISEMDKAGVGTANLYPIDGDDDSSSLAAISQYSSRFITFVDTPDSPQPATWLAQGQAFVDHARRQLSTGKFYGIGETNLRYYGGGGITPPPDIYVPPDNPFWLQLVNLSVQYHVPVSFHFVPDDPAANSILEKMLSGNKEAVFIWAHLGFNNMPLDSATLNNYLLRYPNLYFDTAGIQNMQNPPPRPNSNWGVLVDETDNGRLRDDWKRFFETWNSRILFGSDAGGGNNGPERWQNYSSNVTGGATPNAIGHWRSLFSYVDQNTARNILSANAKALFLKQQKPAYSYTVSSGGKCYPISVNSNSSVSNLTFDPGTRAITFTVAGSNETAGNAEVIMPIALAGGNFTASADGESVKSQSVSNSASVTVNLEYAGGIRSIILSAH